MLKTEHSLHYMGSKFEFDDTREAIGTGNLSSEERKTMLDKFKGVGGKVLSEKEMRRQQEAKDNEKKAGSRGKGEFADKTVKLPSQMAREQKRTESNRKEKLREEREKIIKKYSSATAKFFIRLRCAMAGLTPFGSNIIKPKFLNFLILDLRQALVEFNLIGNDLFFPKPSIAKKVVQDLDKRNPLYMETMEYAHSLHKLDSLNKLINIISDANGKPVSLIDIGDHIKELYKALYYLQPFQETLKKGFQLGVATFKVENDKETEITIIEQKLSKMNRNYRNIFANAFPKLFQLICRNDNIDYPPFSLFLEKSIGIDQNKKLGKRKRGDGSQFSESEKSEDEESDDNDNEDLTEENDETSNKEESDQEEKEEENPVLSTKEYQYGIKLMSMLNPIEFRKKHDNKGNFESLEINDRVLLAYLYFTEFDHEYSFTLTTNKIKLNADYTSGVKNDLKKKLADLYDSTRDIFMAMDRYLDTTKEQVKLKTTQISSNYVEQSKAESKSKAAVDTEGRNVRGLMRKFMDEVYQNLASLIADMKGNKEIVANPDDKVEFQKGLEGNRRLNGKAVKDCILEAYCYSVAMRERLTTGDLFGGIIAMTDDEMVESFGSTFKP